MTTVHLNNELCHMKSYIKGNRESCHKVYSYVPNMYSVALTGLAHHWHCKGDWMQERQSVKEEQS